MTRKKKSIWVLRANIIEESNCSLVNWKYMSYGKNILRNIKQIFNLINTEYYIKLDEVLFQ